MPRTIKQLREAAGLTQFELAVKAGVVPTTVSAWERGIREPRVTQLQRVAVALEVSMDDIDLEPFKKGKALAAASS